jgi:hypothetical protein
MLEGFKNYLRERKTTNNKGNCKPFKYNLIICVLSCFLYTQVLKLGQP